MTEYDLGKVVGDDGEAGNGIASITKTGTSGLVDTYTITYDDGTTTTFTVTNGSDASVTIQTSWGSTTSDSKVPSEKLTKDTLDTKIAKSSTTGLVKNDGSIMTGGTGSSNWAIGNHSHSGYVSGSKVTSWSGTVSDSNIPSEKLVKDTLDDKISKSSTSGLVKNDGTIDTSAYITSSALSNYVQKSSTSGLMKNDGTVMTSGTGSTNYSAGNHTHSNYISTSSTTGLVKNDGSIMTSGTGSSNYAAGNHTHSGYVSTSDIADNLTTNDSTKVLSAKQGKALNDLIGQAISYINQ